MAYNWAAGAESSWELCWSWLGNISPENGDARVYSSERQSIEVEKLHKWQ